MQLRSFSTISVKNTAENLAHTTTLGYSYEIVRGNIVIDIPETQYQFAGTDEDDITNFTNRSPRSSISRMAK